MIQIFPASAFGAAARARAVLSCRHRCDDRGVERPIPDCDCPEDLFSTRIACGCHFRAEIIHGVHHFGELDVLSPNV